jgi:o-succinylbenzoate synthase
MKIDAITIYKFSIPMHPFTIATGTMDYAQNILIKVFTDNGLTGYGECSAFPVITGETQKTCYEMAVDFAGLWKGKEALDMQARMEELHAFTAYNSTIKSAFDMALYDIAAQHANQPLYAFLGGHKKDMVTDITVGIGTPELMAAQAREFVEDGATILKIKLGKAIADDLARITAIRNAVGDAVKIRIDANQGWSFSDAKEVLTKFGKFDLEFCEQPMRIHDDPYLAPLRSISPVKIMADESVYHHYDALRLIHNKSCDAINIKFAKSGGITEARKIITVCAENNIPCMMGGMLESRVALTAAAHFASANDHIIYYDMDTCLLGHKTDPVMGGVSFNGYTVQLPENAIGIGVTVKPEFLNSLFSITI